MPERLLLVGMMGAGKTTVGRLVADALGWGFVDLDHHIERAAGTTVAGLFAEQGEDGFRRLEEEALAACLDGDGDVVVSVGGGAVLSSANRTRMAAGGTVVWLRARPETLAARVGSGAGRPLLSAAGPSVPPGGGPAVRLADLAAARAPLYEAVADLVIDVDDLAPDAAASSVVASVAAAHGTGAAPAGP